MLLPAIACTVFLAKLGLGGRADGIFDGVIDTIGGVGTGEGFGCMLLGDCKA